MREATIKPRPCTQTCLHWCVKTNKDTPTKVMSLERMRSPVNSSFVCTLYPTMQRWQILHQSFSKSPNCGETSTSHTAIFQICLFFVASHHKKDMSLATLVVCYRQKVPARLHFLLRFSLPTTTQMEKNLSSYNDTKHAWLCFCKWQMLLLCQVLLDCNR